MRLVALVTKKVIPVVGVGVVASFPLSHPATTNDKIRNQFRFTCIPFLKIAAAGASCFSA